jgi:hypothetical protein
MMKIKLSTLLFLALVPYRASAQFIEEEHLVQDVRHQITWYRCTLGQRWDLEEKTCQGATKRLDQEEIEIAIQQANEQLGGNWRLPTLEELEGLVCADCAPPKVNKKYFPNIEREAYWTGTINRFNSRMYWSVNFMTGHTYSRFFAYQKLPVLLVTDR